MNGVECSVRENQWSLVTILSRILILSCRHIKSIRPIVDFNMKPLTNIKRALYYCAIRSAIKVVH